MNLDIYHLMDHWQGVWIMTAIMIIGTATIVTVGHYANRRNSEGPTRRRGPHREKVG